VALTTTSAFGSLHQRRRPCRSERVPPSAIDMQPPTKRQQRGEVLRRNLLGRAEGLATSLLQFRLKSSLVAAWRETTWRGRRFLQRRLNMLGFRVATDRARRVLLAKCVAAWCASRVERSEAPKGPSRKPAPIGAGPSWSPPPGLSRWQ